MTTEPATATGPAVAACLQDSNLWLYSQDRLTCIFCGRPPDLLLPFSDRAVIQTPVDQPIPYALIEPPPPTVIGVTCPHCQGNVQLSISDTGIAVLSLSPAIPVEEAAAASQPSLQEGSTEAGAESSEPLGVPAGVPAAVSSTPRKRR